MRGNRSGPRLSLILQETFAEGQVGGLGSSRRFLRRLLLFCVPALVWSKAQCLFELVLAETGDYGFVVYDCGWVA